MPRASLTKNHFNFSKGKLTEYSGLNSPENSLKEAMNVDINFKGEVSRRKGFEYTDVGVSTFAGTLSRTYTKSWIWTASGLDEDRPVVVLLQSQFLGVYTIEAIISGGTSILAIDIDFYTAAPGANGADRTINVAFNKGVMYWTGNTIRPGYYYNGQKYTSGIYIRDTRGVKESFPYDRLAALTPERTYNLLNNGWPGDNIRCVSSTGTHQTLAWNEFKSHQGNLYPSLSDTFDGDAESAYDGRNKDKLTTTKSPSGRAILDIFGMNRAVAFDSLTLATNTGRKLMPKMTNRYPLLFSDPYYQGTTESRADAVGAVASFQGRMIYGSCTEGENIDTIFISQVIEDPADAFKAFAINDPTDTLESSPLATDGAAITIDGLGEVLSIKTLGKSAIILSNNGVWEITSPSDSAFSVNELAVVKLTATPVLSGESVVALKDKVLFWGLDGIYLIARDKTGYALSVTSLSETTIQSLYLGIDQVARERSSAVVDEINSKIYWLYNNNPDFNQADFKQNYNAILILDTRTGAFYEYEIPQVENEGPFITTGVVLPPVYGFDLDFNVIVDTDLLQSNGGAFDVISTSPIAANITSESRLKFLAMRRSEDTLDEYDTDINSITGYTTGWGSFTDRSFTDFAAVDDGLDYSSYIESSYDTAEDPTREKRLDNIFVFFNRTEENFVDDGAGNLVFDYPSSCLMSSKWDWTTSATANKWSPAQQAYRLRRVYVPSGPSAFDYGYEIIETQNRVRGSGKALQMRFESETGKDFQLLGWAAYMSAGATA